MPTEYKQQADQARLIPQHCLLTSIPQAALMALGAG